MSRSRLLVVAALVLVAGCRSREERIHAAIAKLASSDPAVTNQANRELLDEGEAAVPALSAALSQADARVRSGAAAVLWALGPRAHDAVPALAGALADADAAVRLSAAMALESVGPGSASAVPALVLALKDEDGGVRLWAIKALGRIGAPARSALPALSDAARHDALRSAAEEAMASIRAGS